MEFNEEVRDGRKYLYGFATYPDVVMHDDKRKKPIQHLIFGDYISLLPDEGQDRPLVEGNWVKVRSRGETGWIKKEQVQKRRILEVNFVDIGQGDGCHIVTPDDEHIIVDAGQEDNMCRFLSWRFNLRKSGNHMNNMTAIITHPDQDHYKGFGPLFSSGQLSFKRIYHNGIVERANDPDSVLGAMEQEGSKKYLLDLREDDDAMRSLLNDPDKRFRKNYPKILHEAMTNPVNSDLKFSMLHRGVGFVPGFEADKELSLEVLGPVVEKGDSGQKRLRYMVNHGKTKNGHSVILKVTIGKLRILLGGDLNSEAEEYLMNQYSGKAVGKLRRKIKRQTDPEKRKAFEREMDDIINRVKGVFQSDIAKACHHGSRHFTIEYLKSVNPIATVISSGDDESHGHPRPEAIGAYGRYGRGERPLVFSTELARSHKEIIKKPYQLRRSIQHYARLIDEETDKKKKALLRKKLEEQLENIERSVAVYGMINVRTDGEKVIICQKLERPRSMDAKWDIHELVYNPVIGDFEYKV